MGNQVLAVPQEVFRWLVAWPRLAVGMWDEDPEVYLPPTLRCASIEPLADAESTALAEASGVGVQERLVRAGAPCEPPPPCLPSGLMNFAATWRGLRLRPEARAEALVGTVADRDHASPFARSLLLQRADLGELLEDLLASPDPSWFGAGLELVAGEDLPAYASSVALRCIVARLESGAFDDRGLYRMLDVLRPYGAAAEAARPVLLRIAERASAGDYYLGRSLRDAADKLRPPRDYLARHRRRHPDRS